MFLPSSTCAPDRETTLLLFSAFSQKWLPMVNCRSCLPCRLACSLSDPFVTTKAVFLVFFLFFLGKVGPLRYFSYFLFKSLLTGIPNVSACLSQGVSFQFSFISINSPSCNREWCDEGIVNLASTILFTSFNYFPLSYQIILIR